MTKRTTLPEQPRENAKVGSRISYRPIRTRRLLAMALRNKNNPGAMSRLLDDCIVGYLGPKYPKLLADIKAAQRVFGNPDNKTH